MYEWNDLPEINRFAMPENELDEDYELCERCGTEELLTDDEILTGMCNTCFKEQEINF